MDKSVVYVRFVVPFLTVGINRVVNQILRVDEQIGSTALDQKDFLSVNKKKIIGILMLTQQRRYF